MSRQKGFAIINTGGFAIGIAACLLIALYIGHELSYDNNIPNKDRVFRMVGVSRRDGNLNKDVSFPAPMAIALQNDFPEIESIGRIMPNPLLGGTANQVRRAGDDNNTFEPGFCFADQAVLRILGIHLLYGDKATALSAPNTIVLSKSLAEKYYPRQNPVGKLMIFNDNTDRPLTIGGVMQDFPAASHLQYNGFISLAGTSFWANEQQEWMASNYNLYLLLKPGAHVQQLQQKMTDDVLNQYMAPVMKAAGLSNVEALLKDAWLELQPVTDIHLYSYDIQEEYVRHGDIRFVWLFAAVAWFILLLACINFINLATARSANRAKEVGVRKVVGSLRGDLIRQFLTESLLYSILSCCIAFVLAWLCLPIFSAVAGV